MQLPTVSGKNLLRQTMVFPRDFGSDLNLVFIPFQQWHQNQVDSWIPAVAKLAEAVNGFDFYEFPTIYRMNWLGRTFINEGMRAGIPNPGTRQRTVTLYLDKKSFRQALDIADESDTAVILFDRQGQVLWHSSGAFTEEKGAELETAVAQLQPVPANGD